MTRKLTFAMAEEVKRLGVRGIYAHVEGLSNKLEDESFEIYRRDLIKRLQAELPADFIKTDPTLAGFRILHESVGRSNRHYPAASEALIGLLQRRGKIPQINLLVDIYNCVSIESRLALGAHDVERITGNVILRLTDGTENFVPLGGTTPEPVASGEYCYIDDDNDVLCRLEYKQVEKTKVVEETAACFYVLQGNSNTSPDLIHSAFDRLMYLTQQYCGGELVAVWDETG